MKWTAGHRLTGDCSPVCGENILENKAIKASKKKKKETSAHTNNISQDIMYFYARNIALGRLKTKQN